MIRQRFDTKAELYDGMDIDVERLVFQASCEGAQYTFGINDFKHSFYRLAAHLPDEAVADIVKKIGMQNKPWGDMPRFVSPEDLSYYFKRCENRLVFISMGEFQPARCMVYFEGTYPVTDEILAAVEQLDS